MAAEMWEKIRLRGRSIDYWLKTSLKKPEKKDVCGFDLILIGVTREGGGWQKRRRGEEGEKKEEAPKITLEVLDSSGKVIRKFPKKEEPAGDEERPLRSQSGRRQFACGRGSEPLCMGFTL